MIMRCLIFIPRLLIVTMLAECLPIALVPEQLRISSVRCDMVHDCCLGVSSFLQTTLTERMRLKKRFAYLLPSSVVATMVSRPYLLRMHLLMLGTVLLSWWNQFWTARLSARMHRFIRQGLHHLSACPYYHCSRSTPVMCPAFYSWHVSSPSCIKTACSISFCLPVSITQPTRDRNAFLSSVVICSASTVDGAK